MESNHQIIVSLIFATTTIIVILVLLSTSLLYFYTKRRYSYQRNLDIMKAENEKALLNTQLEIQEQTLKNIAQEIHDHIGLSLTLAKLHLNTLNPVLDTYNKDKVSEAVFLITNSIQDLSNISHTLNADTVKKNGLLRALEEELERIRRTGVLELNVKVSEHTEYLRDDVELVIFRIIQESLNNIIKHSGAKSAFIFLDYQDKHLQVTIQDNGSGFVEKKEGEKSGLGLLNIESRTKMIKGESKILSTTNGTTIIITIPYI